MASYRKQILDFFLRTDAVKYSFNGVCVCICSQYSIWLRCTCAKIFLLEACQQGESPFHFCILAQVQNGVYHFHITKEKHIGAKGKFNCELLAESAQ